MPGHPLPLAPARHAAPRRSRRAGAALAVAPLVLPVALLAAASPASAAPAADAHRPGRASSVTLFPSDDLTVRDRGQLTGRRVALPATACGSLSGCGAVARIDELDGFDLDPRLALHFDAPVDVADVIASTSVSHASQRYGIDRVVYDAATHTVYAHPTHQLDPGRTYTLRVRGGRGLPHEHTRFTTLSATDGLLDLRRQLDSGAAYAAAGIPAGAQGLTVEAVTPAAGTVFAYTADTGTGGRVTTPVPSLVQGTVVFGSYLAPSWLRADRTIEQQPTRTAGPSALRAETLPFVLVLPAGPPPAGGWPTAVFGHGFTRSDGDVLLAAATNSLKGIATIATDVVGHGEGPCSTWSFTRAGVTTTLPAHARGVDLDGNGTIDSTEGSGTLPGSAAAAIGSRDGLRQTSADVMALVRSVGRGLVLPGTSGTVLQPTGVDYFGQSFGGIYGTMVAGADPRVDRAVLNVAGGPITEIARLSPSFRPLITQSLQLARLLNSSDPAKGYFDESLPLRGQPPVTAPAPGSLAVQDFLATTTWLDRPGSPETFAPLVRHDRAVFQVAFGDQTVPNPTAYTLLEAGGLFDRAALYRNDRSPSAATNPHGFLLDAVHFPQAFTQGQAQVVAFFSTGVLVDPDGPGAVWQVPAPAPLLLPLNFTSPAFR